MKLVLCLVILAPCARADEAADRAAIHKLIAALNGLQDRQDTESLSRLFTADANGSSELACLSEPWSEMSSPRFVVHSIRFITPGVALVDATNTQYGSVFPVRRLPVVLILKTEGADWRIAAFRAMVACMAP